MKHIQCSGVAYIYGQLEEGWGQSAMKRMQCSGFAEIYAQSGVHLPSVYVHSSIHETYSV